MLEVAGTLPVPIRTCIGCRRRVATAELFRVVATPGPVDTASARVSSHQLERGPAAVSIVPDPRRRLPGRGAWLHPDPDCIAFATRRHAFGRALRVPGPVDTSALEQYVGAAARTGSDTTSRTPPVGHHQQFDRRR